MESAGLVLSDCVVATMPRQDNVGGDDGDLDEISKLLEESDTACACGDGVIGGASAQARPSKPESEFGVLSGLQLTTCECAEDPSHKEGEPCSSGVIIAAIEKFAEEYAATAESKPQTEQSLETKHSLLPSAQTPEADAVRAAAEVLKCDSESCVLSHPKFVSFAAAEAGVTPKQIAAEKEQKFKTSGPRDSTELLNNFHIDETLQRWARAFPEFFAYPFAMMDFDKTSEPFAAWDIVDVLEGRISHSLGPGYKSIKRKAQCAGCVLNTDTSSGPGKHWVAAFVDARGGPAEDWTVEYFNSAGRPPPKPMIVWMERTRARLQDYRKKSGHTGRVETVPVTSVAHQDSQTECGLYGLYFLRRRIEGTPVSFFQDSKRKISDDAMTKFREFIFRKAT